MMVFISKVLLQRVFAESPVYHFTYSIEEPLLYSDLSLPVHFDHDLSGYFPKDFLVRPQSSLGELLVWNPISGEWVSEEALWLNYPSLADAIKIKIPKVLRRVQSACPAKLRFLIHNKLTGVVYETPETEVYLESCYEDYISKLNENLLAASLSTVHIPSFTNSLRESSSADTFPYSRRFFIVFICFTFLISGTLLYLYRDKISK
jgi:hypothetical protein